MSIVRRIAILTGLVSLAGCNTVENSLIFGTTTDLGLSASAGVAEQAASLSLGYRAHRIALIPVVIQGETEELFVANDQGETFSVFAHFQARGGAGAATTACLGDTFATGTAAANIAAKLPDVCAPP